MAAGSMSVIAFHEKAGPSQELLFPAELATVAMLPFALSGAVRSLGAHWAFSVQPMLPSVWRPMVQLFASGTWARRLTQSPELGLGCVFSPRRKF